MEKRVMDFGFDSRCRMCNDLLFDQEKKTLVKPIMAAELLNGPAHQACFMPFYEEERIELLFKVRCYSLGDTISVTPILREIRRLYPQIKITVATYLPDIFKYNPHIQMILNFNNPIPEEFYSPYLFHIDSFDPQKGGHYAIHSVDFAALCGLNRFLEKKDWEYELYYSDDEKKEVYDVAKNAGLDLENDKIILIHPHGTEWKTRDWGPHKFKELAQKIASTFPDYKMVSIGGKRQEVPEKIMKNHVFIEGAIDLYGKLSLLGSAALMDAPAIKLLITPDTGTLHLAATRKELPIIGIFTLVKSEFRAPVRNGIFGYKFIGVESDSPCKCTYSNRFLTQEMDFHQCPKRNFLEKLLPMNIKKELKIIGLNNYDEKKHWNHEQINSQIRDELKIFEPTNLPCFPSVEKVFSAIQQMLKP